MNNGVWALQAQEGRFAQVSGLTMAGEQSAVAGNRVRDVKIGGEPIDTVRIYTVAVPDFLLKEGDGYTMFKGQPVKVGPEAGDMISDALGKYVTAHGEIAPAVEGRIILR